MTLEALHQFLTLYIWFGLLVMLLFWGLLTRYFYKFSKRRTFYKLLIIPAIIIGYFSVRAAARPFELLPLWDHLAVMLTAGLLVFLTTRATFYMLRRG